MPEIASRECRLGGHRRNVVDWLRVDQQDDGRKDGQQEFDVNKPVTLKGTVTKVEWTNPHVHTYVQVRDEGGTLTNWNVEMGSPGALGKDGWNKKTLKIGDSVTIEGWRAKADAHRANAKSVILSTRRSLAAASSYYSSRKEVATSGKK